MIISSDSATIFTFSAIAFSLAVTVALLPSSGEKKDIRDLRIEYGIESEPEFEFPAHFETGEENISDFSRFQIDLVKMEPRQEITRMEQSPIREITTIKQSEPFSAHTVRSRQKFVAIMENNTVETLRESASFTEQERKIHHRAIQIGSVEDCAAIESARAKADCRGEIYFQKAIIDNNFTLCGKIENEELLSRCQNYF